MDLQLNSYLEDILDTYLDAVKGGVSNLQILLDRLSPLFTDGSSKIYTQEGVDIFISVGLLPGL